MAFWKDLATGKAKETAYGEYLLKEKHFHSVTTIEGLHVEYDLEAKPYEDSQPILLEVKFDGMAAKTGNVAIELSKRINNEIKPSGLSATTAHTWVYTFSDSPEFYHFPVFLLKELVEAQKYDRCFYMGDGYRNKVALFKRDFLIQFSIIL